MTTPLPQPHSQTPQGPASSPTRSSFRLLPMLILAMGLVLTIRVGDVWQEMSVGIGTETQAQTAPATDAAEPAPAADTQSAATEPPAPAEGAPAEDAAAAETAPPEDPLDFTDEEVEVLQQLAKRREELDLRARQLDEREAMVAAAEQRMEQKMAELRALQTTVEDLLVKRSEVEEAKLQTLVQTYEKMKPKDAAQVFEEMDMDLLRDLVSRMKTSRAAPILALVSPTKVKELTLELAEENALPFAP